MESNKISFGLGNEKKPLASLRKKKHKKKTKKIVSGEKVKRCFVSNGMNYTCSMCYTFRLLTYLFDSLISSFFFFSFFS